MQDTHTYTIENFFDLTNDGYEFKDSDKFFTNTNSIYEGESFFFTQRGKIARGETLYICGYCKQKLQIYGGSGSRKQTLHFRHVNKESKECVFQQDKKHTKEEILRLKFNGAKESIKHEEYKNLLASILRNMENPKLSENDVLVEKIYRDRTISTQWRKPDVLAKFPEKSIAFELQLSTTFLSVIAERESFYREHGVYILWIFDKFSIEEGKYLFAQMDILVSNNYNVFVWDEEAIAQSKRENKIYLKCYYIDFYIKDGKIHDDRVVDKIVPLEDLTFRKDNFKIFWKDATKQRRECEDEINSILNAESLIEINDVSELNIPEETLDRMQNHYNRLIDELFYKMYVDSCISFYNGLSDAKKLDFINTIVKRYQDLIFGVKTGPNQKMWNGAFYFLKSRKKCFDSNLIFKDKSILDISGINQPYFPEIISQVFIDGYILSDNESDKIQEQYIFLLKSIEDNLNQDLKIEIERLSMLLCCHYIQSSVINSESKNECIKLLFEHWTFISKMVSIILGFVIGCKLPNMASIADNIKSHYLEFAHLFVLLTDSEIGKKRKFSGKSGGDNLIKLKEEMKTSTYKKNDILDKLMPIIFPKFRNIFSRHGN